jgi:hypothetical protein
MTNSHPRHAAEVEVPRDGGVQLGGLQRGQAAHARGILLLADEPALAVVVGLVARGEGCHLLHAQAQVLAALACGVEPAVELVQRGRQPRPVGEGRRAQAAERGGRERCGAARGEGGALEELEHVRCEEGVPVHVGMVHVPVQHPNFIIIISIIIIRDMVSATLEGRTVAVA